MIFDSVCINKLNELNIQCNIIRIIITSAYFYLLKKILAKEINYTEKKVPIKSIKRSNKNFDKTKHIFSYYKFSLVSLKCHSYWIFFYLIRIFFICKSQQINIANYYCIKKTSFAHFKINISIRMILLKD